MKRIFSSWIGRSLSLAALLSGGAIAAALPTSAQSLPIPNFSISRTELAMSHPLEQNTWQLVSYRDENGDVVAAWDEQPATFQFQAGQLTGTTGCNRFFNSYTLADNEMSLAVGGSTLMACFPEALAQQEAAIFAGMSAIASYTTSAGELQLLDAAGDTIFNLAVQEPARLTDTEWQLTAYNNGQDALVTPLNDADITAMFDEQGRLSGSAGCNFYRADFTQTDQMLTIGAAASTRRLCQPDSVMLQEQAFLALLEEVASYSISGNQLSLKNSAGTTLAQFSS